MSWPPGVVPSPSQSQYYFTSTGDYSIEAQHIAEDTEKDKYGDDVAFRLRLDFRNLIQLFQEDRAIRKAVVAGSVPPEMKDVWKQLEREGIRTEIIDKSQTGGAEHNLPDMTLQWEMLHDAITETPCGTAVLLTGDGAGWELGRGFLPTVQAMKRRGWKIELHSWQDSCNRRLMKWAQRNGVFVRLDDFYESITYIKSSDNRPTGQ